MLKIKARVVDEVEVVLRKEDSFVKNKSHRQQLLISNVLQLLLGELTIVVRDLVPFLGHVLEHLALNLELLLDVINEIKVRLGFRLVDVMEVDTDLAVEVHFIDIDQEDILNLLLLEGRLNY